MKQKKISETFFECTRVFYSKTGGLTNKWTYGRLLVLTSPEVFLTDMKTSPTDSFLMIDPCELILRCFYTEVIFLVLSRLLVWKRLCSIRNSSLLPGSFCLWAKPLAASCNISGKKAAIHIPVHYAASLLRQIKIPQSSSELWAERVYFWLSCARICATCACEM